MKWNTTFWHFVSGFLIALLMVVVFLGAYEIGCHCVVWIDSHVKSLIAVLILFLCIGGGLSRAYED